MHVFCQQMIGLTLWDACLFSGITGSGSAGKRSICSGTQSSKVPAMQGDETRSVGEGQLKTQEPSLAKCTTVPEPKITACLPGQCWLNT